MISQRTLEHLNFSANLKIYIGKFFDCCSPGGGQMGSQGIICSQPVTMTASGEYRHYIVNYTHFHVDQCQESLENHCGQAIG